MRRPIWKSSYRLALDRDGVKTFLQGWAMVNTTDEDWNNVKVACNWASHLFQMDLYEPFIWYICRQWATSPSPPVISGRLGRRPESSQRQGASG